MSDDARRIGEQLLAQKRDWHRAQARLPVPGGARLAAWLERRGQPAPTLPERR